MLRVEKTALCFDFQWLNNRCPDIEPRKKRYTKIVDVEVICSWIDFLLDNLYITVGDSLFQQIIGIPMGTNCAVFLANFYLFTYEFEFMQRLISNNTCPTILHKLSQVRRFVDVLFVSDIPNFEDFMYKDGCVFGEGIYPRVSCELNCSSRGDTCALLDLNISQSASGLEVDIYDKRSQPEYSGVQIIRMPDIESNISVIAKYGVINSQLHRFFRLCTTKEAFIAQCTNLIILLIQKGYSKRKVMKKVVTFLYMKSFIYGISALGMCRLIENKVKIKSGELNSPLFY